MRYITPKEAAAKWGISQRRVHALCLEGRIEGAERHGWLWLIPETADKPGDARVKSGRYVKRSQGLDTGQTRPGAGVFPQDSFHMPALPDTAVERSRLIEKIAPPGTSLTYIHADAGYGKTTLLMQYARGRKDVAWLSLDERDGSVPRFLHRLEDVLRDRLHPFDFHAADHIPLAGSRDFIPIVLSALLGAIGHREVTLILDDVHFLSGSLSEDLLTGLARNCPPNLNLVMASRHEPWGGLYRLKVDGRVSEIAKDDLCFNREETEKLWGFYDEAVYAAAEGWVLALQSYRVASREGGKLFLPIDDRYLHRYLMEEIFKHLPEETRNFLQATAWLPELDVKKCDSLLGIQNSREILENLVRRNIFTTRISPATYRYHTLFAAFLKQNDGSVGRETLRRAMADCFARGEYEQAADYALLIDDAAFIHDCISAALGRPFGVGRYSSMQRYFDCMEAQGIELSPRVLLARGMYLSSRGQFFEAERCLNAALPALGSIDQTVWRYAMVHKAKILRSRVSIEESSRCIDSLLPLPEEAPLEDWYLVMIEKIHNLALTTRLGEALKLTLSMMEKCLSRGSTKVKAWFERYLAVIYFYKGDYLKCLHYYGKSMALPEEEQDWLSRHCVGAYAAKAYQITGQEEKVLLLMEAELSRLRRLGLYEELSVNFLMYAEVLLAEETRKMDRGEAPDFTSLNRYLGLAEEYAALNRNTKEYSLFAKVLRLGADLLARPEKAAERIDEVLGLSRETTPFFQAFVYWRIANALHMLGRGFGLCKDYYLKCIETGEMAGTMNFPTIACGELAAVYLREGDKKRAEEYTRRFMELSLEYGQRYYFRLHGLFGGVLALAMERGITPDFTREVFAYGGYAAKRVYVNTMGSFYIAPAHDRNSPVKIRTQKARELLAYMLEHREGVYRERIYADLWEVSEANVTSLFHTRRGEIRRAFESLGAKNPIRNEKGIYRLDMAEIACDYDDFLQAAEEFRENPAPESAQRVVDRYNGRYLDDMEALWAESTRLCFEEIFLAAAGTLMESCLESGEQAKLMELLRRCTGQSCQEYRIDAVKEGKKRKRK